MRVDHQNYLAVLVRIVSSDGVVNDDWRSDLIGIAQLLEVPIAMVLDAVVQPMKREESGPVATCSPEGQGRRCCCGRLALHRHFHLPPQLPSRIPRPPVQQPNPLRRQRPRTPHRAAQRPGDRGDRIRIGPTAHGPLQRIDE